jgi:subtilisin family serine protease
VIAVGAVGAAGALPSRAALSAPGEQVLTLVPGGSFDFASGSSIAAAHVSGVLALMRALEPGLDAARAQRLLAAPGPGSGGAVDACRALQALRPALDLGCSAAP